MDLIPCNETARANLAQSLFEVNDAGLVNKKMTEYVARTFPSILLDIARFFTEQATKSARESSDPAVVIRHQLKPYLMFNILLGKSPQITGQMYGYFENSSFQPLPENLFQYNREENRITYTYPAFNDELVIEILYAYFKYLCFNPKWFSAIWNWGELGRFITLHTNNDVRYLAGCCLSIITRPTRRQHLSFMRDIANDNQVLISLQINNRNLFENTFKPCIETKKEMADQYVDIVGRSSSGYSYCSESIAKVANILLLKRDVGTNSQPSAQVANYIPIDALTDTISKIAYSLSINKPCLIRGPCGSGKTAILDHIAAQTNRTDPPSYVKVQISDQLDSKLLIGSYVCTEIPGQFEWQPGPLTKAMAYGSWIVFEDIDSAPSEMAQVIHSVLENGNLTCVSCCPIKLDSPHPEFRILFTQKSQVNQSSELSSLGTGFVERLCDIVTMPELKDNNLREIIDSKYKFGPLTQSVLRLFRKSREALLDCNSNRLTRKITLRDLFKFCDRILALNLKPSSNGNYANSDLETIYLNAIDCFISSLPKADLIKWAEDLGQILNISSNEVRRLILHRNPDLREDNNSFAVGRAKLQLIVEESTVTLKQRSTLAYTKQCIQLIESVAVCVSNREPVLLVGETGVGKTSVIQHIANLMKTELIVVNLSQQSDSSDLLGGYKPVEMREIMRPLHNKFDELFRKTFDVESNKNFLHHVSDCFAKSKLSSHWIVYTKLVCKLCAKALENRLSKQLLDNWNELQDKARRLSKRILTEKESSMALAFSEGSLLRAVREGKWILLDEINLAEPEVLQCLILILDSIAKSKVYMHGSTDTDGSLDIHPNFRLFACMNPSTDVGKKDLDTGTRNRFTEFFVDDVTEKSDLRLIVESYVKACFSPPGIANIVEFYQEVRARSVVLSDISGNSPIYSLRTLCRALSICSNNVCQNIEKSLLESIKITFLQQLNEYSISIVMNMIETTIFHRRVADLNELPIAEPKDNHQYEAIEGFWIQKSGEKPFEDETYIKTTSVKKNLKSLVRIISLSQRKLPILIQGNTSVGKTSLIMYLAKKTGNKCYRINNHEHTDLQEYVGRYTLDENGEIVFKEGLLVRAMRKGYWIILDELNLAPCELLEALNRVLDDNRELFIPETREIVKAHSKFILFATQNPPEEYAGRKVLSRAFRNRFIELHFDEIPSEELEYILAKRCEMPDKYAKRIVAVMKELQLFRRESGCFNGKNGFMTMRDLFRWGERYRKFKNRVPDDQFFEWDDWVASEGLILLEGRVRTLNEADTVKNIIEKAFKLKLDRKKVYSRREYYVKTLPPAFEHIHFTEEFKKLYVQLSSALDFIEPVLLCGQTGCGKTTACQLYAADNGQKVIIYNCHMNTESSDFVGCVRPSRLEESAEYPKQKFAWVDGPLVESMKNDAVFLMDEISLADDAVLERINSVLEPSRSIMLTEEDGREVIANDSFRLVATMNPGGDYGKKELSPALRNRFTEIYCHNTADIDQIRKIIEASLSPTLLEPKIASELLSVMHRFLKEQYKGHDFISIRDVISWTHFLNKTTQVSQPRPLSIQEALLNGASLVFFDQFGTCGHKLTVMASHELKTRLRAKLKGFVEEKFGLSPVHPGETPQCLEIVQDVVKFKKFYLHKGPMPIYEDIHRKFIIDAPSVKKNMMKIVRAMQLERPILLEGDPGAGKTSVVQALAKLTGHKLVRINLSEQTDISDLFGSDLPDSSASNDGTPSFCWHDGPLLSAINQSHWILLDEMNLASQTVLEGLNACLDHRGEIFIPELNRTISVNRSTTRIFACQNPYNQGAARKGLPQSFLNRFTSIFIEPYSSKDLSLIIERLHPNLPSDLVTKMVNFNNQVDLFLQNSGYEFNLRDILYWCDLLTKYVKSKEIGELDLYKPEKFVQFVYLDRMRSSFAKSELMELFENIFGFPVYEPPYRDIRIGEHSFIIARSVLPRKIRLPPHLSELCILKYQMPYIESFAKAIEFKKMPILVGDSGVGKRSIVKILAGLTGNELNIIGANRDMDTIELLGSFEQKSLQREVVELVDEAKGYVNSIINSISQKQHASTWRQFFSHIWATLYVTSIKDLKLSKTETTEAYRFQLNEMKDIIMKIQPLNSVQNDKKSIELLAKIDQLTKRALYQTESMYSSGNFEWIDSILIKSIKEGSWLMIENANLMNPATLDRLNSLVEPSGVLSLNEKGSGPDGVEIITPHPDFRLILTVNPEFGELSRAMRNRGIEIFIHSSFYFEDFLMLLNQNGFEPEEKKACMTYCIMQTSYDAHKRITGEQPEMGGSLLAYFGLNYITTLTHQVRRGLDVDEVLADLIIGYYSQRGFIEECNDETLRQFIKDQMIEYRKTYEVNLIDERYKWRHLRHDLISLTGGDAISAMLDRDNRIFFDDFNLELLLKPDEMIENIDIVNTCTNVKIFLEIATHGDFEYRKGFIKETFLQYPNMMKIVNNYVDLLHCEFMPILDKLMPRTELMPISEMHVDTRNSPDIHYYLKCFDYDGTIQREKHQNRWILSLHRIMLRMIVDLVEDRTMETHGNTSLWTLSEKVRIGQMMKEDLIRPAAEFASDLYDLLHGILRSVSQRCFDNPTTIKMLPKLFWINYFICKLRRGYNKTELIAVCNQLPMLWALTYHKILVPLIKDCDLADLNYKNKKFSYRIQHICDSLDMTLSKPGHIEKFYYQKVLNMYASTSKICESVGREVDKFFGLFVGRYTARSQSLSLGSDNLSTLAASGLIWSNSIYMNPLYNIEDRLLVVDLANRRPDEFPLQVSETEIAYDEAQSILLKVRTDYYHHEEWLNDERYKTKCLNVNRRRNALDQFAPIWQLKFLHTDLSELKPDLPHPNEYRNSLRQMLSCLNGIVVSPRYYSTVMKFLQRLEERNESSVDDASKDYSKALKEDFDMYSAYLADHLYENVILDHQVVGWTKLRVTTSDLPSMAPLIPEYSPIISLVGGYCLDISHLKLNFYLNSSAQLDSMIIFLWRNYVPLKLNSQEDIHDIELARNLLHYRSKLDMCEELFGDYWCQGPNDCQCLEQYIRRRVPTYEKLIETMNEKLDEGDSKFVVKAIKLIYFGYINFLEYAPIFTLDPSLRTREKLEVYKSELAHIKLDLHFRNTLFYWKTGENLQLTEIDPDDAVLYPFPLRILVERRAKLERSIIKLKRVHSNRPKSDDGSLYFELRKEVEVNVERYTNYIHSLMSNLVDYSKSNSQAKTTKFNSLVTKCRMIIKSLEKTISSFKSDYSLYTDLITNFLVGMSFVLKGLRCLYSKLEQKMQIQMLNYDFTIKQFMDDISKVFSFSNFTQGNIDSVQSKIHILPILDKFCPQEEISHTQSVLLKTILIQLNHHITITPSDIKKCMPIVRQIADKFHEAWLKRKQYLEEERKKREEFYEYKPIRTTLGEEISYERQEFLDICTKFPTYDHIYQSFFSVPPTSAEMENLETEQKVSNLSRSVDLSMCIDICKAHYKFINEASRNLLGQVNSDRKSELPNIDLNEVSKLEAETLYTIIRHCIPGLDHTFDGRAVECHLLQAHQLSMSLRETNTENVQIGSLKSSIEILDEDIFDIYHCPNAYEALKFQEFISRVDNRISQLRNLMTRSYDDHPILNSILKLISKISSFLITDPLMKFITGSHTLLEKIESWNYQSIPIDEKMNNEALELIELINSWRKIEIDSWRSSLHQVKRKYIDNTLCDLWFALKEAFNDPIRWVRDKLRIRLKNEHFTFTPETEQLLYSAFSLYIRDFIEDATCGDYQIRLDLVFSFAIQTRFASIHEHAKPNLSKHLSDEEKKLTVDFEKLTSYVYNTYRQYESLMKPVKDVVETEEKRLSDELNAEIRIVSWSGYKNFWDIKNNFRISHRKLNKVMNKYLEVLRRPVSEARTFAPSRNDIKKFLDTKIKDMPTDSSIIRTTLMSINILINNVRQPKYESIPLTSLEKAPKVVEKLKQIYSRVCESMTSRYAENFFTIEQTIESNADAIRSFHSHNVEKVEINPKDSKESAASKHKLCRQMYNSKKFEMQRVFKSLQQLGASYQRGLNILDSDSLDQSILSLEPLRGMIQNQTQNVLNSASQLVHDNIVNSCNDQYRKLVASTMCLLAHPNGEDLDADQMNRVRGYSTDMLMDVIKHYRSAAVIYRQMMAVQAVATRLKQLQEKFSSERIVIHNFGQVHGRIQQLNELVGRAYLAISKLENLTRCCEMASELETSDEGQQQVKSIQSSDFRSEKSVIKEIICKIEEDKSMMTRDQISYIRANLEDVRQTIAEISHKLRDMLNNTIRNYVYSNDDIEQIENLYAKFFAVFDKLVSFGDVNSVNLQHETVLGSLRTLLDETKQKLGPIPSSPFIDVAEHPNLDRLNLRLQKLVRESKLAVQGLFMRELEHNEDSSKPLGESAKRKLKPFNCLDSGSISNLLRLDLITKHAGDCFVTLNRENDCTDITSIVEGLTPILYIYTQDVACYLNLILTSLQLKLETANQLVPFFSDLVLYGFGLPYKVEKNDGTETMNFKASDDNTGFGEGEGNEDVSKKLEFESQLDELKQAQEKDGDKSNEMESIKAHDDGVEMSQDIDAKAEGPDSGAEDQENQEDEAEDEDNGLAELDKQLDTVDSDEETLDEKLWGEEDKPPEGEDDEEDLREADVDSSSKPNNEETELQAKDQELSDSKMDDKSNEKDEQQCNGDEEEKPPANDTINNVPDEANPENCVENELDLEEEAAHALKEQPVDPNNGDKPESKDDKLIDMDVSDDEQQDHKDEENRKEEQEKTFDVEADNADDKSEGEISEEGGDKSQTNNHSPNPLIDDEDIDNQLEVAISNQLDKFDDPFEDTIRNIPAVTQSEGQDSAKEMKGSKIGSYTLYNIFLEEDDDPLDFDEEVQKETATDNQPQQNDQQEMTATSSNHEQGDENQQQTTATAEANGDNKAPAEEVEEQPMETSKSSKRVFADTEDDQKSEVKRQKILEATDSSEEKEHEKETERPVRKDSNSKRETRSSKFRHIKQDKKDAVEVIDLVSDDENNEEVENRPDKNDRVDETKLEPKLDEERSKNPKAVPDVDMDFSNQMDTDEEGTGNDQQDVEKEEANPLDFVSSISSLESGELALESDQEEQQSIDASTQRDMSNSYNTNFGLLKYIMLNGPEKLADSNLLEKIDNELSKKLSGTENDSVDTDRLTSLWLECTKRTGHLVYELCQQLQIVLQPTKMSKYKGDYKTGKRLNMRKIISYIASHYRKDKIWLRRTKPSKRTYNITLAVDNSSSMSENNCRQMTYQSLALLAKSLSLVEAGSLNVVSFGEKVKCMQDFGQPYVDALGAQWLRELKFNESRTSYKQLLFHSCESFAKQAQVTQSQLNVQGNLSQLLIIISDGRNVTSEEDEVKNYLRQLKSMGVLTLFVIIDDLKRNNGQSIVDVKTCVGLGGNNMKILNYMEQFPFPFYVLLRQLETMPSILGDALRQWFELVSNGGC